MRIITHSLSWKKEEKKIFVSLRKLISSLVALKHENRHYHHSTGSFLFFFFFRLKAPVWESLNIACIYQVIALEEKITMSLLRKDYKQCNNRDDEDELFEAHSEIRSASSSHREDEAPRTCWTRKIVLILSATSALVFLALTLIIACVSFPGLFGQSEGNSFPFASSSNGKFSTNPVVQTNCGSFEGELEDGAFSFKVRQFICTC